jgi:hypothetical protein
MRDVIVVRVSELPSNSRMFWGGIRGGVLLFCAFFVLSWVAVGSLMKGSGRVTYVYLLYLSVPVLVAAFATPLVLLVRYQSTLALPLRAHIAALGYATGLICIPIFCWFPFQYGEEGLGGCALTVLYATIGVYLFGVLGWGVGFVFFRRFSRVVIQDGTLCPGCGYSLIGNTSMVCPECGRGFTFAKLGTTEQRFRAARNGVE